MNSGEELGRALAIIVRANQNRLGMVSADIPLISNLEVQQNIALILQYHEDLPRDLAYGRVLELLGRLRLEGLARLRPASLAARERFLVMLLRAVVVREASVVIERPFRILTEDKDALLLLDVLDRIKDLYHDCHIYDLAEQRDRYGLNNGQKH